jgi:hypothetical protein
MITVKQEAMKLLKGLPDEVNWDDIMYEFYVRQKIENAIKYADNGGETFTVEETKKNLLLST